MSKKETKKEKKKRLKEWAKQESPDRSDYPKVQ